MSPTFSGWKEVLSKIEAIEFKKPGAPCTGKQMICTRIHDKTAVLASTVPHGIHNIRTWIGTRGSAIAEEPRDALRQLKYYGRF